MKAEEFLAMQRINRRQQARNLYVNIDRAAIRREVRNQRRRDQNAILREICGTSARAAREDMGL